MILEQVLASETGGSSGLSPCQSQFRVFEKTGLGGWAEQRGRVIQHLTLDFDVQRAF